MASHECYEFWYQAKKIKEVTLELMCNDKQQYI